jgi:hypothetical protein
MNNYRGISLGVTFILLSICTPHIGAEETDRQALPPIQFVGGDTRFTAANQERVDLVRQIPGLVALLEEFVEYVQGKGADELRESAVFNAADVKRLKPVRDRVNTEP